MLQCHWPCIGHTFFPGERKKNTFTLLLTQWKFTSAIFTLKSTGAIFIFAVGLWAYTWNEKRVYTMCIVHSAIKSICFYKMLIALENYWLWLIVEQRSINWNNVASLNADKIYWKKKKQQNYDFYSRHRHYIALMIV